MGCKECIIGVLNYWESYDFATVEEVKQLVKNRTEYNSRIRSEYGEVDALLYKEWRLEDYFDKRKNTDLARFDYCPYCGKKIDWRKMKHEQG